MKGSFFNLGPTNPATKLNSWLSHRLSSSPSRRCRSSLFKSQKRARMFLICESSCSAAVLQSGTRCVGVGLGAGVGGDAGADGSRLWCIGAAVEERGLVGVIMGRGCEERDIRLCFRGWVLDDENLLDRTVEEEAAAEAAMSVSESGWTSGMFWSSCG